LEILSVVSNCVRSLVLALLFVLLRAQQGMIRMAHLAFSSGSLSICLPDLVAYLFFGPASRSETRLSVRVSIGRMLFFKAYQDIRVAAYRPTDTPL
jgi:hypothetical protein